MKTFIKLLTIFLVSQLWYSCGIYSFTGASTAAKTFSIKTFSNQASMVVPSLAEKLSEKAER